MACSRIGYDTKSEAKRAIKAIVRRKRDKTCGKSLCEGLHLFKCLKCLKWHLSVKGSNSDKSQYRRG